MRDRQTDKDTHREGREKKREKQAIIGSFCSTALDTSTICGGEGGQ